MNKNFKVLNKDPLIREYSNFLDINTCKKIIEDFGEELKPSMTTDGKNHMLHEGRISKSCFIDSQEKIIEPIIQKLIKNIQTDKYLFFNPQLTLYEIGGKYVAHSDAFDFRDYKISKKIKSKGQRVITNIIYLNNVFEGGETSFPMLQIKVPPESGKLVSFNNCMKGTLDMHPMSIHESLPVIKGKKFILTFWAHSND